MVVIGSGYVILVVSKLVFVNLFFDLGEDEFSASLIRATVTATAKNI